MRDLLRTFCTAAMLLAASAVTGAAQGTAGSDPHRVYAARTALEAQAARAESAAAAASVAELREHKRAEAFLLRQRLEKGDFLVGDRIVVTVVGEPALTDTTVVRAGGNVQLGKLPAISLQGVLRSELEGHLTSELAKYVRDPRVTAVPLVRIAVFGQVVRPGYVHVPADILLTDLLMSAGGPAGTADVSRAELRRGAERLLGARDVRTALADGISLDDLHLRSGDELNVPQKRTTSWATVMQASALVTGLLSVAFTLSR